MSTPARSDRAGDLRAPLRPRVLLTHPPEARANYYGAKALAGLCAMADVRLHEGESPLGEAALIAAARECDVIIADRATPGFAAIFPALPQLKAFLRVAVDIRNIDVAAASAAGVLVCQAQRSWVPAVSELALGLMIDISRGVSRYDAAYKAETAPDIRMGRQLAGATAGIIGYGHLGRRMAELLTALGMVVLVHDPYVKANRTGVADVTLAELLTRSDYVLPLAVATDETENLIDAAALAVMKPDAFLINLSRGNLVDEAALEQALDEGRLAGAAMDVGRAPDQMPSPRLAARANVVATPHIGGLTQGAIEGQALTTVEQVAGLIKGHVPEGAVNASAAGRVLTWWQRINGEQGK